MADPPSSRSRPQRSRQEADTPRGLERAQLNLVGDDAYPDWEAVYRDNVEWVYRLLFAKVGNRPDAEDLTSEVFLAALRPLRVSASAREVRAYLLATSRTVLAGYGRRTLGRQITTIDPQEVAGEPGVQPPGATPVNRAQAILAALPERYASVLRLRFLDARSIKEAAAELGISVGATKVLQLRALRAAAMVEETEA